MEEAPDPYSVLNLTSEATIQEVKAQYHKLLKEWHPDHHKTDESKKEAEKKVH